MSDTATTKRSARQARGPFGHVGRAVDELDERLGVARVGRVFLDKIFPDHWSFMLGEIALYSFVVLIATGIFLSLFFIPSQQTIVYHGSYAPLRGQLVSQAYGSTVDISFGVRGGLLIRQMHHWAADIFTGAIVVHMARIFFTGAFRKPRELNWTIGILMLILAIFEGFIGYSLPDDLISGTGLRIGYSIALSIPFVGSYLTSFLWGGTFPGNIIIPRFYIIHILIIPALLVVLLSVHLGLLVHQKHTQFAGEGRTENNVVGSPMFPTFAAKTTGFLFMVAAASALLGAFAQINPIWQFGSYYNVSKISYAVQPDWYMGWLDGALRIMPSWEFAGVGHTVPLEVFLPAVVFPGLIFTICFLWPAIERRWTGDNMLHNLLDRPRDRPKRTAAGAAMIGTTITAIRKNHSVALSETWKKFAMTSVELAANSVKSRANIATPAAVRLGRLRGRSSRWWISLSPVYRRSMDGHSRQMVKIRPGNTTAGRNTSKGMVCPHPANSHEGMMRSAPSSQPMYQSGWTA